MWWRNSDARQQGEESDREEARACMCMCRVYAVGKNANRPNMICMHGDSFERGKEKERREKLFDWLHRMGWEQERKEECGCNREREAVSESKEKDLQTIYIYDTRSSCVSAGRQDTQRLAQGNLSMSCAPNAR